MARLGLRVCLAVAVLALAGFLLATRRSAGGRAAGPPPSVPVGPEPAPFAVEAPAAPEPPAGESIRGIVRDAGDASVAGAEVTATDRYDMPPLARTRTGADGTFALGPLEAGFVEILAEHPERGVAAAGAQRGDFVELWLLPGATLVGTVRARDGGRPLAGASVYLGRGVAKTDGEGRYAVRNLPTLAAHVVVVADGYRQARRTLSIGSGETRTLDFAMERGDTVAGTVTDARTGAPILGAEVAERAGRYAPLLGPADRRTRTDAQGRYVLDGIAAEPNDILVCTASGYVAAERESDGSGQLDFALEQGFKAAGLVVDPDGRAVAGAAVHLHRVKESGGSLFLGKGRSEKTETDATGRFRFDGVVPGVVAFVATAEGFAPGESAPLDARDATDVQVRLVRGMTIEVTVRDAHGLGVEGAWVNTGFPKSLGDKLAPVYGWRESQAFRTDEAGRLRLEGLLPGEYVLAASHPRRGSTNGGVSGNAGDTVPVALTLGGLEIEGLVVTSAGAPGAGARVRAFGGHHSGTAFADALGRFRIPGLPEGSFRLQAVRAGAASEFLEVAAGAQGVGLRLASQMLRGTVRGAERGPLGTFSVSLIWKQPRVNLGFGVKGGDGSFEEPVPPGTYDITVQAPGHRPTALRGVVVQAGVDPPPFDFLLEPAAMLRGTARGRDGRPLPYVWVTATATKPEAVARGGNDRTDQEGRYVIDCVGPGEYAIVLNTEREGTSRTSAHLPATGTVTVDLRLGPTGAVAVRVVDAAGNAVPRAYVTFRYADHGASAGEGGLTDADGTLSSRPLPADVALIARAAVGDRRAEAQVKVGSGGNAEALIVLP